MEKKPLVTLAQAGIIAALYVALTFVSQTVGLASGAIQVRISEALSVLPFFTPAAIPGLTIGCLLANLLTGCAPWDILFGSIATLLGAIAAYFIGKWIQVRHPKTPGLKLLVPVPNLVSNVLIVPWVLRFVYGDTAAIWFLSLTVGAGELIAGVLFGSLLLFALEKRARLIFRN